MKRLVLAALSAIALLAAPLAGARAQANIGGGVYSGPVTGAQVRAALGYTPVNKAGDTMTGDLKISGAKLGVGTTTPQSTASVTGSSLAPGNVGIWEMTTGTGASTDEKLVAGINGTSGSWLQAIKPGTGYRTLYLQPSGNGVSIGNAALLANTNLALLNTTEGSPANTGTADANVTFRIQGGAATNQTLDFGWDNGSSQYAAWIQPRLASALGTKYDLWLNPRGGNVAIGTLTSQSQTLYVNGTAAMTGTTTLSGLIQAGGAPANSAGSCGATIAGGLNAGTITLVGACAGGTVSLSSLPTAPTGWSCVAVNRTSASRAFNQTSSSTTQAILTGTGNSGDVINFQCMGY